MTTGEKIALQRRKTGLSQEALAEQLGISRQAVSRWETNESLPDTERIIQLARIFGVSTDYLLLEEREQAESAGAPPEAEPVSSTVPEAVSAAAGTPPHPETPAVWLFRRRGACIVGGGAVLSLTALFFAFLHSLTLDSWYTDYGKLGTALRIEWFGSGLTLGLLLMLIGILLLAVNFFLRKWDD